MLLGGYRAGIYEERYETVSGNEIRKALYLANFSMVNMILCA